MEKDSFVLYGSQYDAIKNFTNEQKGELLDALFRYVIEAKTPDIKDREVRVAFAFFRMQIDMDTQKYEAICEKRRAAIQKRWQKDDNTKENKSIQMNTNVDFVLHNDNDNDNDNDKKDKSFFNLFFLETEKQNEQTKQKIEEYCQSVMKYYNDMIKRADSQLRPIKVLSDARKKLILTLVPLGNKNIAQGIINAVRSDYLNGRTKARTRPADFDWIMRYENFVKCVEGTL